MEEPKEDAPTDDPVKLLGVSRNTSGGLQATRILNQADLARALGGLSL